MRYELSEFISETSRAERLTSPQTGEEWRSESVVASFYPCDLKMCAESYFLPVSLFPSAQLSNGIAHLSFVCIVCGSEEQEQGRTYDYFQHFFWTLKHKESSKKMLFFSF